jgi:spermidine synthase
VLPRADRGGGTHGRLSLGVTVFLAGVASLATEIGASRLVAPYFGSSNVVWANVIGLMLGFLALGYWLGGRAADARPEPWLLARILLAAALLLTLVPYAARPLLRAALHGFDAIAVGTVVGSFFAVLALFVLPVTLMGAVTPFALRLALGAVDETGRVAGRLYALSTIGSILGTFLAALVAIPLVGTRRTLIAAAVLLALAAVPLAPRRALVVALGVGSLLAFSPGSVKGARGVLWERESPYQYVRVVQRDDGSRVLELNEGVADQSIWYPRSVLTGGYWDLFLLLPPLLERQPQTMLVLGDAGGTIPRAYARFYPHVHVDGVELDPDVTEAARRFFGLDRIRTLRTITDDGRRFLERTDARYDIVVVDAYRQPYVPFQLATKEFFELVRDHLRPGGVVALNVAATPHDHRLSDGVASTLAAVFPHVWRWRALRFSDLVFAFDGGHGRLRLLRPVAAELRPLLPSFRRDVARLRAGGSVWTDDRAPVEWITDRMLAEQIARGEGLDERLLPTQP